MVIKVTDEDGGAKIVAQPEYERTEDIAREIADRINARYGAWTVRGPQDHALMYQVVNPQSVVMKLDPYVPAHIDVDEVVEDINDDLEQFREVLGGE